MSDSNEECVPITDVQAMATAVDYAVYLFVRDPSVPCESHDAQRLLKAAADASKMLRDAAAELSSLRSALSAATARAEAAERERDEARAQFDAHDELLHQVISDRDGYRARAEALSHRVKALEAERDAAVAAEREACAKVAKLKEALRPFASDDVDDIQIDSFRRARAAFGEG